MAQETAQNRSRRAFLTGAGGLATATRDRAAGRVVLRQRPGVGHLGRAARPPTGFARGWPAGCTRPYPQPLPRRQCHHAVRPCDLAVGARWQLAGAARIVPPFQQSALRHRFDDRERLRVKVHGGCPVAVKRIAKGEKRLSYAKALSSYVPYTSRRASQISPTVA